MVAKKKKAPKSTDDYANGIVIQVNPDWRMVWDGVQFIVQRRHKYKGGKRQGSHCWIPEAYCCSLDNAVIWLARKRMYAIPGTYGLEGLDKLGAALDEIKAEAAAAVKAGLAALATKAQVA